MQRMQSHNALQQASNSKNGRRIMKNADIIKNGLFYQKVCELFVFMLIRVSCH